MSVAKPLPHESARLHVTGTARYTDDFPAPAGCLHLAFGLSEVASGTLNALDVSAVRAAPGVVAVLTADDFAAMPDCSPSNHDEPLLCTGRIHYAGQPLYLVIAESHLAARRAARLHRADVTEATPILTIEEALAAEAWFDGGPRVWSDGDVATALAEAPHILQGQLEVGGQEHFYLEGQAALALPGEGGDMHVLTSTQHPTEIQHKVADALGVPMHAVRSEVRRMGGGFGGKESQGNALAIACAVAAARTGRAARMRYDRDDDFVVTGKRHDMRIGYEVGHDAKGRLLGIRFRHWVRCGWSQDLSLPVADRAMLHADNAYDIPAMEITSWRLRTNTQSATAFRGFGGPQGMVGIERVLDHVAHAVGRDPLEVRRLNFYAEAGRPADKHIFGTSKSGVTHYGQEVSDFCLGAMTDQLAATCDYAARRQRVAEWNRANPVLKRGIALTPVKFGISFTLTHLNQAGALVHVYADGSVNLNHGGTEMGQGLHSKVAQVAASRFGCDPARIRITATDTGKVPNTSATAASSGADLNGMAVRAACDKIRDRMADFLAAEHQTERSQVIFADDSVRVAGAEYSFAEVAAKAYMARVSLSSTGFYATPEISWDRQAGRGRPFYYFAYGASCSEVVINTLTGENRILRTDILHDAGASLNPALDIGQVEGGFAQGAGWLTMEELVWDGAGRLRTHAPATYKIPCASDMPEVLNVLLWQGENREETIYRSKAVGEPPFMHGISVFLALSDALSQDGGGYPALDAPATAERLLMAHRRLA
ncbi:xanthine dehydrogenase molybdopterin binding subunit [Jannaschia pagri]|uniref:Xanthine dehydrogenase molybdopterin binding subunit n=1 Tax=Jannaschia pagri TaxID=2829797 RepID=A0ABQ4NQJ0_9RHOB|nr:MULTISPECIES: xanthine dehydrogenase molybdopterin binding subunit [unclassified Jannaschia]GIT92845.1 xanthine dehydrogenase molybdopterin binding subunit [Jannaschia sp. AI_61]GIT96680.1 xanthine dehydrogenase molybdopterin binding subunit [Jannaschia sp. AI_62]